MAENAVLALEEDRPLYNSRIIDNYLKLIRKRYPHVDIAELLTSSQMQACEVADQGHWFTQKQVDLFYDATVRLTGNANIAQEAGRYSASPDALGFMKQNLLSLLGPARAFELIKQAAANLTRSSFMESRLINPTKVEIIVTVAEGVHEKPFQCANRIGCFESILMMFDYSLPKIEHPECIFEGCKVCRYIISWEKKPSETLQKIRNYTAMAVLALNGMLFIITPGGINSTAVTISLALIMTLSILAEKRENKELKTIFRDLREPTDKLFEQVNSSYASALITNEVGQAISHQTEIDGIIASVFRILESRLGYDRGMILMADQQQHRLVYRNGFGNLEGHEQMLKDADFSLKSQGPAGPFVAAFRELKPLLISSTEYAKIKPGNVQEILETVGLETFICCPIICDGAAIGVFTVDRSISRKPLLQTDLNLLMGIAPMIGVSIRNAELVETKDRQFNAIIQLEKTRDELAAAKETTELYAEDLRLMNEEVKNFAYIVSHDLRAPLVNIKGFSAELRTALRDSAQLIEKGKTSLVEAERQRLDEALEQDVPEALDFIESSVNRMEALINAILKLSRIGRRDLRTERVNVAEIVSSILKTLGHQLDERNVATIIGPLPGVISDKTAIEQIVGNLLDNAVKYLDRNRPGRIEVDAETTAAETIFNFRDNGRGIAPEDMGKVFEIFRRAGKQDTPGEGMGLAYVKTLVRRLGGKISCQSEVGMGTVFSLTIPHAQEPQDTDNGDSAASL